MGCKHCDNVNTVGETGLCPACYGRAEPLDQATHYCVHCHQAVSGPPYVCPSCKSAAVYPVALLCDRFREQGAPDGPVKVPVMAVEDEIEWFAAVMRERNDMRRDGRSLDSIEECVGTIAGATLVLFRDFRTVGDPLEFLRHLRHMAALLMASEMCARRVYDIPEDDLPF